MLMTDRLARLTKVLNHLECEKPCHCSLRFVMRCVLSFQYQLPSSSPVVPIISKYNKHEEDLLSCGCSAGVTVQVLLQPSKLPTGHHQQFYLTSLIKETLVVHFTLNIELAYGMIDANTQQLLHNMLWICRCNYCSSMRSSKQQKSLLINEKQQILEIVLDNHIYNDWVWLESYSSD